MFEAVQGIADCNQTIVNWVLQYLLVLHSVHFSNLSLWSRLGESVKGGTLFFHLKGRLNSIQFPNHPSPWNWFSLQIYSIILLQKYTMWYHHQIRLDHCKPWHIMPIVCCSFFPNPFRRLTTLHKAIFHHTFIHMHSHSKHYVDKEHVIALIPNPCVSWDSW